MNEVIRFRIATPHEFNRNWFHCKTTMEKKVKKYKIKISVYHLARPCRRRRRRRRSCNALCECHRFFSFVLYSKLLNWLFFAASRHVCVCVSVNGIHMRCAQFTMFREYANGPPCIEFVCVCVCARANGATPNTQYPSRINETTKLWRFRPSRDRIVEILRRAWTALIVALLLVFLVICLFSTLFCVFQLVFHLTRTPRTGSFCFHRRNWEQQQLCDLSTFEIS